MCAYGTTTESFWNGYGTSQIRIMDGEDFLVPGEKYPKTGIHKIYRK